MKMIRYRTGPTSTFRGLERMRRNLHRIGRVTRIRGYRYRNRYGLTESVMVYGQNGTAQFGCFCWSYGGTGPCGLVQLLMACGVSRHMAEDTAFDSKRYEDAGTDWEIFLTVTADLRRRGVMAVA